MKFISALALMTLAGVASAATYTFTPPGNSNLSNLDHYDAYKWGININLGANERITGASLEIKNIWDWTVEQDILYVDLLDLKPTDANQVGVKSFYDNQASGDYFQGQGVRVGTWSDPVGGYARNFNLKFDFAQQGVLDDLQNFAKDGFFALTFDPDCHYFNDGVKLKVYTETVPEPASMFGLAVAGAALLRKKFKKA
ncbi:MAG: PEP-CTERM sorting domain-containing protein [Armatimonadetes bacterium]|nr:PEP-CTERM sorting domain-containing protein [Armatimonadota bacterium]MBS1711151.1 PEP-CTERM sorting domain-containing protein [Armatimonadota bacterium]MBX3108825.1 PEP-CTERM sorting domain-containing protein [Fimbriimonadaceae bacterium]